MSNKNTSAYSEAVPVHRDRCFFCGKQSSDWRRNLWQAEVFIIIVGSGFKDDTLLWTVLRGPHHYCVPSWERTCLCDDSYQEIYCWFFFMDKSNFWALQKNHTLLVMCPLSLNMSCGGLTCHPGEVFYGHRNNDQCSSVTRNLLQ